MSQISETAPKANDVVQTDAVPAAGTLVLAHALARSEQGSEESDASTDADSAAVDEPGGRRGLLSRMGGERGAATAEYAVATMAAVGFAGLLVLILRGDEVRGILTELVRNALTVG